MMNMMDYLRSESEHITYLLEAFEIPETREDSDDDDLVFCAPKKKKKLNSGQEKPTESAEEKQERKQIVQKKFEQRKATKGSQSNAGKSEKKKLKLLKKQQEINKRRSLVANGGILKKEPKVERVKTDPDTSADKPAKKEFNKDEKLFFSKIEIEGELNKKKTTGSTNPRENLMKLKQQKKKIRDLAESGDKEKAMKEKQKQLWDAAFKKTEGLKVKDNEDILKKTIKKRKIEKKKSKVDWKQRGEKVKEEQEKKQKKRQDNIEKKKTEKHKKKHKLQVKLGRVF